MDSDSFDYSADPGSDERYTPEYIEREAFLILRFFSRRKKNLFQNLVLTQGCALDNRILQRWGLK